MFGLSMLYIRLIGAGAAVALLLAIYVKGRVDGRSALQAKLAADRVVILKNNQEITNEILGSDDDALCAVLGGCELPDGAGGD